MAVADHPGPLHAASAAVSVPTATEMSLRASFDQAAVGLAHVGIDGRWLRVNRRLCDMLGYSESELLRGFFQDVTYQDDLDADLENVRALLAGDISTYNLEKRYVRKGGGTFWGSLTVSLLREADGAPRHFVSVVEDISARKGAEAALAESEARLQDLVATLDLAALLVRDLDGRIQFWADGCARLYGWNAGEAVGRMAPDLLGTVFPEPAERVDDALLRTGSWSGDLVQRRRDGSQIIVAARKVVRRNEAGQPVSVMESLADVTELRQLAEALEVRVRDAVAARESAQARLNQAEKLTALGQLAGGIAHDFNNVLQAVRSGCGLLRRRALDPVAVTRTVGMIEDVTIRGISVTQRLLSFARRGDLRAEPVDGRAMIAGLCELFSHTLGGAIVVRPELPQDLPLLMADKAQLETVLVNLASNARDAMPQGGTLTVSVHAMKLDDGGPADTSAVFFQRGMGAGWFVCISMADTGVGMAPEVLTRVTEPFFTTKPAGNGTGLGLAMAKGFAEQSGGGIGIATTPGVGSRIDLWLPVAACAAAIEPQRADTAHAAADGGGKHILVVDDDKVFRRFIGEHLELYGYEVMTAEDATAALTLLDDGAHIDLVVCDLSMPGMNGIDLVGEIHRRRVGLPAILLTGFATQTAQLAANEMSGAFMLLHKPISEENLAAHVAMLLEAGEEG